jgi:hypothetical protein
MAKSVTCSYTTAVERLASSEGISTGGGVAELRGPVSRFMLRGISKGKVLKSRKTMNQAEKQLEIAGKPRPGHALWSAFFGEL